MNNVLKHFLTGKSQDFALELIFSHLSYEDHKNAEKVSIEWRHLLSNNNKIWKNLLEKNVSRMIIFIMLPQ